MAELAIKGHSTRGEEVIEILEMLGGWNYNRWDGKTSRVLYFINEDLIEVKTIRHNTNINEFNVFTLEEFEEKYPYKVGDNVTHHVGKLLETHTITGIRWDSDKCRILYYLDNYDVIGVEDILYSIECKIEQSIKNNDNLTINSEEFEEKSPYKVGDKVHIYVQNDDIDGIYETEVAEISSMRWNPACRKIAYKMKDIYREFYKEEIKCKVDDDSNKMKNVLAELLKHIETTPKEELEREFKEIEEWSNVGPTVEEFMDFCNKVNKKPQYPTTYKECCKVLGLDSEITDSELIFYYPFTRGSYSGDYTVIRLPEMEKFEKFIQLYLCRNSYWKIAGEQMGLGKPWDSVYGCGEWGYWIGYDINANKIYCQDSRILLNNLLVFPTKEMRDKFYVNFKDLIEQCKELL